MKLLKRYKFFILMLALIGILLLVKFETGVNAAKITLDSFKEMLLIIPPIFVLLGLLDVWVPRETMVRYLGEDSGIKGMLIAILIGSAAAGPLYAAFPVALVLMKKGAKFSNILLFIGAWSTTKIPMLLFELSSLGAKFMLTRLAVSMAGIFIIALIVDKAMSKDEVAVLYDLADKAE